MTGRLRYALGGIAAMAVMVLGDVSVMSEAAARGGGSNFMNSPGYQRRLQESRGYVTNRSGSVLPRPIIVTPYPYGERRVRRRR